MTLTSCSFGTLDSPESVSIEVMPAAYLSSHSLLTLHETDLGPVHTSMSPDGEICRWILDNGDTTCAPAQLSGIDASSGLTADANLAWHVDFGSSLVLADSNTKKAQRSVPGLPRYGRNEIDSEGNIWSTDQDSVWFSSVDGTNTRRISDDGQFSILGKDADGLPIIAVGP